MYRSNVQLTTLWFCFSLCFRWTNDHKALALKIYFPSPSAYATMKKVFVMLSGSTLQRFGHCVSTLVGYIRKTYFSCCRLRAIDGRGCPLLCHYVWLHLTPRYCGWVSRAAQEETGCVQWGAGVYSARFNKTWKQVLGFFFSRNAIGTADLCRLLLLVIERLHIIGVKQMWCVTKRRLTVPSTVAHISRDDWG